MKLSPTISLFLAASSAFPLAASQENDIVFPPAENEWMPPGEGDVRSPCPFINTLANHGFINRSGKDVDIYAMVGALVTNFDVAPPLFLKLAKGAIDLNFTTANEDGKNLIDIDVLNTHNKQEHDASFVRADHYFGAEESQLVDPALLQGFINDTAPESDVLTQADILAYQTLRIEGSKANNPQVKLVEKQTTSFSAQATLWLVSIGQDPNLESVSKDRLYEFLNYERFPEGFVPSRLTNASFVPHDVIQAGTLASDVRTKFADNFVSLLPGKEDDEAAAEDATNTANEEESELDEYPASSATGRGFSVVGAVAALGMAPFFGI